MKRFIALVAAILSVALSAVAGTMYGHVESAAAGTPLKDIYVSAMREAGPGYYTGGHGTFTDGAGNFAISNLEAGVYVVEAEDYLKGYAFQWYANERSVSQAAAIPVGAGDIVSGIDFALLTAAHITGQVSGGGGALEGLYVRVDLEFATADGSSSVSGAGFALTDAQGGYDVGGLPPGRYTVQFSDPSGGYAFAYWMGTYSRNAATPLDLTVGQIAGGVNASLVAGASLAGHVSLAGGGVPADAMVYIHRADGPWQWDYTIAMAFVDETNGSYRADGLPPGEYAIEAHANSMGSGSTFYGGAANLLQATRIDLTAGEHRAGLDIPLQRGGELGGLVRSTDGVGLADVGVSLQTDAGSHWETVQSSGTDGDGRYFFESVTPGAYVIQFETWDGTYPRTYYPGVYAADEATVITVASGQSNTNLDVVLLAGGSISGRVTTTGGTGVSGITVSFERSAGDYNWEQVTSVETDAAGDYTGTGLPPGSYHVRFRDGESGLYAPEYYDDARSGDDAQILVLAGGEQRTGVNAELGLAGTMAGRVTDTLGAPLRDISVGARIRNGSDWDWSRSVDTGEDGGYVLDGLAAGTYIIEFTDRSSALYAMQYYRGVRSEHSATQVVVIAGSTVSNATVMLALAGRITGTVTDTGGVALAGVYVSVYVQDAAHWYYANYAETDPNGQYAVGGLPAGVCAVQFWGDGYSEACYHNQAQLETATPVLVTAGATTANIDESLRRDGELPADENGNGVPDNWERTHFGSTNWCSGLSDWDSDGFPDVHEYWAGTDPTNKGSLLNIGPSKQQPSASGPVMQWPSVAGRLYRIQRSARLAAGFSNILTGIPATPPLNVQTDTTAIGAGPWYYRIGVELP